MIIERKESQEERKCGTFLKVRDAPLRHDGDPGGHVGSLPLHAGFIQTLTGFKVNSAASLIWTQASRAALTHSGVVVNHLVVDHVGRLVSFGLRRRQMDSSQASE